MAERLAGVFSDFRLEVFAARHHFDPPHRVEPERVAALRALWDSARARLAGHGLTDPPRPPWPASTHEG